MLFSHTITLENFEGPLDLLVHLIQKEEIDISVIHIRAIIEQWLQCLETSLSSPIEIGAEFLGTTAFLLWIKSQKLLPVDGEAISEEGGQFQLIEQLLEYCRIKEAAMLLSAREDLDQRHFPRGIIALPKQEAKGVRLISPSELTAAFQELLQKEINQPRQVVVDEEWQVADQIPVLKQKLAAQGRLAFKLLFSSSKMKGELIVLFLALLELMKSAEIYVTEEDGEIYINNGDLPVEYDCTA